MECASVQRDASSIAWCPVQDLSSLNIGYNKSCSPIYLLASVHQEMDTSFNSTSQIEILNTSPSAINNKYNKHNTITSLGNCVSKLNFTSLTWGQQTKVTNQSPLGLIAGGMEDGSVTFWNPYNLINDNKTNKPLLGQYNNYHQQRITAMQFNPSVAQHTFLATADVGEKLFVWDLTNPSKPIAQQPPGGRNTASTQPTYPKYATALAWNNNVSYILAVSNCLGQTQIYDLRNKKVALTFESKNIDKAQSISWNPNKARQLAVCYVKGEAEIWDLKQPKSPKMYLRDEQYGHTRPILDLSWNCLDSNLLMTSGDDCIGNIWNGNNGKLIHQISFENDPKLKIEWNNLRGGMLATMSTQNIAIYNVNYLGDRYCPKWAKKKCGVQLGFGGKVISFGTEYIISTTSSSSNLRESAVQSPAKTKKKLKIPPNINIDYLPKSPAMIARAEQFKKTLDSLSTPDDLRSFTDSKLKSLLSMKSKLVSTSPSKPITQQKKKKEEESEKDILSELGITDSDEEEEEEEEEKEEIEQEMNQQSSFANISKSEVEFEIKIWEMIRLFFNDGNCKDDIIQYLGFEKKELIRKQQEMEQIKQNQIDAKKPNNLTVDTSSNKVQQDRNENNLFDSDAEDTGFDLGGMGQDDDEDEEDSDDEDFFNALSSEKLSKPKPESIKPRAPPQPSQKQDDRKDESSTDQSGRNKLKAVTMERIEKRFEIPSKVDMEVRNAIITGNYELAIDLSLNAGNIADALVFAYYGQDEKLWDIVSKAYFQQHSQQFIANTFKYIAENDYSKLVENSDLKKWRETLAILLTFTEGPQFMELCNNLGQRILETQANLEGAIACFLCSHNISQLISIWTIESKPDSNQIHKKPTDLILHSCITKALIYVNAPFVQQSLHHSKQSYVSGQAALSSIFCKYANLLANQGSLSVAQQFLQFINTKLKQPNTHRNSISSKDPQIQQLISRISTSQTPGTITNAEPYHSHHSHANTEQIRQSQHQQKRLLTKPTRPGPRPKRRPSGPNPPISSHQRPSTDIRKPSQQHQSPQNRPTRPNRPPRGGKQPRPIRQRPSSQSQPPSTSTMSASTQRPPNPNIYGADNTMPNTQPSTSRPSTSSMPNRSRPRGSSQPHSRGRAPRGGHGRGGRQVPPSSSHPTQQPKPQRIPPSVRSPPTSSAAPPRGPGGMNGTTPSSHPPRAAPRGTPRSATTTTRGGSRGAPRGAPRSAPRRGRGRTMPSNNHNAARAHPQPRMPPTNPPNPAHVPPSPVNNATSSMPMRAGRGRGMRGRPPTRGRGGGGVGMRGSRPTHQPVAARPNPTMSAENVVDQPITGNKGYSASQTSSGSGYFGQTSLLDDDKDVAPLPDTATETLANIKGYLQNVLADENIMSSLSVTQGKSMKTQSGKLEKDLNDLILNNKMSYYAYSSLLEIFNSLQSRQYDNAMKLITEFTKSCKSNKQEKFATHRKWVMALQSIIRIAKQYNI